MSDLTLLPRPLNAASIGAVLQTRRIEATEAERAAIAKALDLVELPALAAELELRRDGRDRIHVEGRVVADIVQSCVVSLEPVPQHIDEPISMRFTEEAEADPESTRPGAEIRVDPTSDDPPEVLTGVTLDLGPVVMEHFVLAIDPYPRAPGAAIPDTGADDPEPRESPFAALARLKENPGKK